MTNNPCHFKKFKTIPEIIGPLAKADPMTKPAYPIVEPRLFSGVMVNKTDWNDGNKTPTPIASKALPSIAIGKFCAVIMINVPSAKIPTTLKKIFLNEKLFNSQGLIGIMIHMINIKPVVNHWIVGAVTPKNFINVG